VEVESGEFDGFAEALAGWDACFSVLVVLGLLAGLVGGRGLIIRHVFPIGVGACALPRWFWAGFLVLGCYGLVGLVKGWMAGERQYANCN